MDAGSGGVQTARNTDPCIACGGGDDDGEILLCDECNGAYHMTCMGFKGPLLGDWLCRSCQEKINVLAAIVKDRAAFDGELKKVKKKRVAQRNPTHRIICSGGDDEGLVLLCDECAGAFRDHCFRWTLRGVGFEGTLQGDWLCPSCE